MHTKQFVLLILLAGGLFQGYGQEGRQPTANEKAVVTANCQLILQNIPNNFDKIKKGTATDFYGIQAFESTVHLFPGSGSPVPQRIFFETEKGGKTVKTFTEEIPFSIETSIELLTPLFKQNGMTEVAPVRPQEFMVTRSFKGKNGVLILSANPITQGTIITIGKPYYYYETVTAPVIVNKTDKVPAEQKEIKVNPEADKKAEEKLTRSLIKLYKSATNKSGSFKEYETVVPEKSENVTIYNVASVLELDDLQAAFLFKTTQTNCINGISMDIKACSSPHFINALNKMAKTPETSGEVITEKKRGVTRYALRSKSLAQEIISLLDFEYPGYSDRLICQAIYNSSQPVVEVNQSNNGVYKNYMPLPPSNPSLLENSIQLGFSTLISKQLNPDGSFAALRQGNPIQQADNTIYEIANLVTLPNISTAQLFVAKNDKGTSGLVMNIDPAITGYYINAVKNMIKDPQAQKEIASVTSEKKGSGETIYTYTSLAAGSKLFIIIDHPDPKEKDDVVFFRIF